MQDKFVDIYRACSQHVYSVALVPPDGVSTLTSPRDVTRGTAFAISADGHFLTARHVLRDKKLDYRNGSAQIALTGIGGTRSEREKSFEAKVVEEFEKADLAVLKAERNRSEFIPLASPLPVPGAWIATIGYPAPELRQSEKQVYVEQRFASAMISGGFSRDGYRYLEIDKNLTHGHSGGPVISMKGYCVGVATELVPGPVNVKETLTKRSTARDILPFVTDAYEKLEKMEDPDEEFERWRRLDLPIQFTKVSLVRNIAKSLRERGIPVRDPNAGEEK